MQWHDACIEGEAARRKVLAKIGIVLLCAPPLAMLGVLVVTSAKLHDCTGAERSRYFKGAHLAGMKCAVSEHRCTKEIIK